MKVNQNNIHKEISCPYCETVIKRELYYFFNGELFCNASCCRAYTSSDDPQTRLLQKDFIKNSPRTMGENERYRSLRGRFNSSNLNGISTLEKTSHLNNKALSEGWF